MNEKSNGSNVKKKWEILHVGTAHKHDSPFILSSSFIFEKAFPAQNTFLLVAQGASDYLYPKEGFITEYNEEEALAMLKNGHEKYDVIVLHGLGDFHSRLAIELADYSKLLWLFWGAEVYNNPLINKENILGPLTEHLIRSSALSIANVKSLVRKYLLPSRQHQRIKEAASKVRYIGVPYEEDFTNLRNKDAINNLCRPLSYSYYPPEHIFTSSAQAQFIGNNILLGNSATPENNHMEALELLSGFELGDRKIITILSYGDDSYKNKIVSRGQKAFPEHFMPIVDFMPLVDYNALLGTCSVAIMNHYRQQAVGNILSLLWIGTKVFLSERNTMYHYLKRIDCHIFTVSELTGGNDANILEPLNETERIHNRHILASILSTDKLMKHLQNFFDENFKPEKIDVQKVS